jgi:hypothetical protein
MGKVELFVPTAKGGKGMVRKMHLFRMARFLRKVWTKAMPHKITLPNLRQWLKLKLIIWYCLNTDMEVRLEVLQEFHFLNLEALLLIQPRKLKMILIVNICFVVIVIK